MKTLKDRMKLKTLIITLSLIFLFILPASGLAKIYNLTILHTNDHHGHFTKFDPYPVKDVGGLAAQSTLINIIRSEAEKAGSQVIVLSAGDINTGVPESDMLDAEPDIKMMNLIGYDAMTLGNHEFDNSLDVLMKQREWAEFPFLSANIIKKSDGKPLVDPYITKDLDGLKVAIFGLTTEETPVLVLPQNVAGLEFKNVIESSKSLIPKLRQEADVIIALTHLGFFDESGGGYNSAGDFKLAEEVNGIDVIIGGHSHTVVEEAKIINETIIVQAGDWSKYVGRLDLTIDSEKDKVTDYDYRLIPVNMKKRIKYKDQRYFMYVDKGYIEDNRIIEAGGPFIEHADDLLSQPVGKALVKLVGDRETVRSQETNLANLVTDAMRAKTKADIAFQNSGGIRSDIAPGAITYRDILKVQPFGNTLVLLNMTGQQIMDVLGYAATIQPGNGAFLQVSGLKWTNNKGVPEEVSIGDSILDTTKTYKVVTNNFMASGGDGYKMLKEIGNIDTGFVDADSLKEYIETLGEVEPKVEGRLTHVK
ncbi:5'-nucleotidase C-terminal domain-containing protein [Thermodesulfobacteriota bacterium]